MPIDFNCKPKNWSLFPGWTSATVLGYTGAVATDVVMTMVYEETAKGLAKAGGLWVESTSNGFIPAELAELTIHEGTRLAISAVGGAITALVFNPFVHAAFSLGGACRDSISCSGNEERQRINNPA